MGQGKRNSMAGLKYPVVHLLKYPWTSGPDEKWERPVVQGEGNSDTGEMLMQWKMVNL